ncbi:MAG: sigma-70 family RNA polymerase sigma factor [Bryobacteraceae bacterium]
MDLDRAPASHSPPLSAPSAGPAADRALIEGLRAKDRKATADFINRYTAAVVHYLRSRLWPRQDIVDDLAQEVFLAAWQRLDTYRGDAPIRAWLLGIARHKVEDHYRDLLRAEPVPMDDIAEPPDEAIHPDDALDQTRLNERTRAIISSLQPPYGLLLIWRYWEKRSLRDMAERTGRTEKAIERLLARARIHFRRQWDAATGEQS